MAVRHVADADAPWFTAAGRCRVRGEPSDVGDSEGKVEAGSAGEGDECGWVSG